MAHACRVFAVLALAGVIARGSMTVSWNTRPSPSPSPTARTAIQTGRLLAVQGTRVQLRLRDGSIRNYTAAPEQAGLLRGLIGTEIEFRVSSTR